MFPRTQQANRTAVATLTRSQALISALALGVLLLAATPAGAASQPSPMLFPVAAYDGGGQAIDVPFWQRPGNARVLEDSNTGAVLFDNGPVSDGILSPLDPNSPFEGGPGVLGQCNAAFGCGTGQGACGFVFGMTLPFHTLTDPDNGCFKLFASAGLSSEGTWTVDVPITAEDDQGNPLVFDHWSAPGAITTMGAPANVPRCRTGDLGLVDGLDVQATPDPQAAFTTAAEYRAWTDLPGVGGPTAYEAHYTPRSPDTTAPLISISRPYDCRYLAKDAVVEPAFRCDDMGGSGVQSCAVTGDVTAGGKLDTSTTGEHSLTVTATDNDGNTRSRTVRFYVDGGPPKVTITASPNTPAGNNGWYNAAQLGAGQTLPLTVTATDTEAGMRRAWCSLDGAPEDRWINSTDNFDPQSVPPVAPVVAPITAYSIGQGTHTLSCHAEDRLGQDSGAVTRTFKVDTVAPPALHFLNDIEDQVTYCIAVRNDPVPVFPAYVPRQVKWVSSPDDASGLVDPSASSGLLDADTTPTALPRTLTAPTAVDAAGNSTPGDVCTYKVGPVSSFVPASRTYDVRSGDRLTVPAPGVLTDSAGRTPSTPLTILTLTDWSGIPGATFTGPSASGAFDATMPARSPSSSTISATYRWQGQEASGLPTAAATVTVRLQRDTERLVNGGSPGCQVTAYPVGRQLRGRQPTQVWGRATYRCTAGDGKYVLHIELLRGGRKVTSREIAVGATATTSSIQLGTPAACATGDRAQYRTLVSLTNQRRARADALSEPVAACAGP